MSVRKQLRMPRLQLHQRTKYEPIYLLLNIQTLSGIIMRREIEAQLFFSHESALKQKL